ncbi:hypothetical protein EDEG_00996 [Edhazardia aedis USNM 41457]|uniref:Uncharacterized protein n=1 Tax=Edhazardia aedis (strain USNM 41457) TaxID=1003232 RepID=J9DAM2_EDHAE|nr:hypothetical protein EDEG_00996 [Edhazardia aedis USNM 41457]|eukprot:EJW04806.1 hypothetical protein EDEG_00996 [Edhazardia aedis USNM 41457]
MKISTNMFTLIAYLILSVSAVHAAAAKPTAKPATKAAPSAKAGDAKKPAPEKAAPSGDDIVCPNCGKIISRSTPGSEQIYAILDGKVEAKPKEDAKKAAPNKPKTEGEAPTPPATGGESSAEPAKPEMAAEQAAEPAVE